MAEQSRSEELVRQAKEYLDLGWSVIPLRGGDKRPSIRWERFQKERADLKTVKEWFRDGQGNMGIVTGKISNLAVVDIDTEGGQIAIKKLIPSQLTPTVKTPNGTHLYFQHPGNGIIGNNARRVEGCDFRGDGGYVVAPPSRGQGDRLYTWKRHPSRIRPIPLPLAYSEYVLGSVASSSVVTSCLLTTNNSIATGVPAKLDFALGTRDIALFKVAAYLKDGGMGRADAEKVVVMIGKSCVPPFPEKEALEKVKSAYSKELPRERSLAQDIREWVLSTSGHFLSTDIHRFFDLSTRVHKKNCSEILRRLVDAGVIERFGNKNGVFRKIESDSQPLDWKKADVSDIFPVKWPFDLERLVTIYPKNIIVVAGASNAGKTAFLLNVAQANLAKHKVSYFSSEMGPEELRLRLNKFDLPDEIWEEVEFYDRSSKFADVIRPDGINIIDYLELTDNFFAVGGDIKEIFDRLEKGIAIIAIQKKAGQDLGHGATFTVEKARLYLAMDQNRVKIVKAKNFAQKGVNPNGREFRFKLVDGCRFIEI